MRESTKFNGKRNYSKGRGYCFARSPIKRPIIRTAQTDFCNGYLLLSNNCCTSARPFPAGGFPPKLQYSNAEHLGDCFSAEKYR